MEINRDFFPEDKDINSDNYNIRYSESTSNFTENKEVDISAGAIMSGGSSSPVSYATVLNAGEIITEPLTAGKTDLAIHSYDINLGSNTMFLVQANKYLPEPSGDKRTIGSDVRWGLGGVCEQGYVITGSTSEPHNKSAFTNIDAQRYWWWGPSQSTPYGYPYEGNFITGFSYNSCCVGVVVNGFPSLEDYINNNNRVGYPLDEYPFDTHPFITRINISFAYGDKNSRSFWEGVTPAWLFSYDMPIGRYTDEQSIGKAKYKKEKTQVQYGYNGTTLLFEAGEIFNLWNGWVNGFFSYTGYGKVVEYVNGDTKRYFVAFNGGKNEIERMVACLGLYFTGNIDSLYNSLLGSGCTDENIRLPIKNGDVFKGDFVRGTGIADAPNADWGDDPDDPYNWYGGNGVNTSPDDSNYTDKTPMNKPTLTTLGCFNRSYAMTYSGLRALSEFIWNADESIFQQLVDGLKMLGANPLESLIDMRLYPFDILSHVSGAGASTITLGRTNTGVSGVLIDGATNCIVSLGSVHFREYNHNFLDYEPYTTAELYIPYIGKVPISAKTYCGHDITIYLVVDFTTGSACAVVYCDGIATDYHTGTIGIDIPITGSNSSRLASNVISAVASAGNSITSGVMSTMTGNAVGMISSGVGAVGSLYDAFTAQPPIEKQGGATSACWLWCPQTPYLIIHSPIKDIPSNYGHNVGFACEKTARLGDLSGFTVCFNPDTSGINCTETERAELKTLLQQGIYL